MALILPSKWGQTHNEEINETLFFNTVFLFFSIHSLIAYITLVALALILIDTGGKVERNHSDVHLKLL